MNHLSTAYPGLRLLSRVGAAVLGGYLLASALGVFSGALFPGDAEAVLAGVQLGFAVHVAAVIWAFSPVALGRVWAGLLLPAAALAALAVLLPRWGA